MSLEYYSIAPLLALPLFGALMTYVVGSLNRDLSAWVATGASFLSFVWVLGLVSTLPETGVEQVLYPWILVGDLSIDFTLRFDRLTAVMALVVTGIGSLIHLYSVGYMAEEPSKHRFFAYLNLFMFSMLTLILGANLPVLFVGWEGVGLCSYLLIGFWFKNEAYARAGRKAFVVNRIGDAGMLLGMFLLYAHFGSLDFVALQSLVTESEYATPLITTIALALFVGATGKSAQLPLFVWLPDAMAGPTPVSALIHAATMVTAGVYLLARTHFIFALAPTALAVVTIVALLTAFVAATTAVAQNDIKKVLAYSTVSQLGFMFLAAGAGAYWVAIFHVITHAFFKACLFLGAGSVIHGCHHEQDMRHMGGLGKLMPITFITYGISTLAIAGVYPFAGYQSKHAILAAWEHVTNPALAGMGEIVVLVATLTAGLTAFYMTRSVVMTFAGEYRGHAHPHESPWIMTVPLIVLAALATVGGIYLAHALPEYLSPVLPSPGAHHPETITEGLAHSWVGILGIALGFGAFLYGKSFVDLVSSVLSPLRKLFERKYYIDELYAAFIVTPLEDLARILWRIIDQGIIDGIVNGTASFVGVNSEIVRHAHTGQIRHYALFMFVGAITLIVFYMVQ